VWLRELPPAGSWPLAVAGTAGIGDTASVLPENNARHIRDGRLFRRDGSSNVPGETS
jgi:hypothetical protein